MNSEANLASQIAKLKADFSELNNLFEIGKICNQSSDIYSLSKGLTNFIFQRFDLENVVFFIESQGEYITLYSQSESGCPDYIFKNQNEGLLQIIQDGWLTPLVNEKGENLYKPFFEKYELNRLNSSYWLPVMCHGNIKAIISIGLKQGINQLSDEDQSFFNRLSDYISPIVFKFIKQKEKEDSLTTMQKNMHNISILYNIGQAMNFIDDLKGLLKVVLEKALVTLHAEKGSLMLFDYASNELIVKVVYGLPDKEVEEKINEGLIECTKIKIGEGIAGNVFLTRQPIITNLGNNDPRFIQSNQSNVNSILCLPLIVKNEAIGVINITNKKDNKLFDKHDLEFMKALANQAAIAIDNAQLYEMATKDGLTKLYIYRHFRTLLENEFKRSQRYQHPLALLMLDIDNFKIINDTYGHRAGDSVLKEIAAIIESSCRKVDYPSRYGGEEFALILPETAAQNSTVIAERIRSRVEDLEIIADKGAKIKPTISIGIAEYPEHAKDKEEMIEFADQALYNSKKNGKNRISMFSHDGCFVISK